MRRLARLVSAGMLASVLASCWGLCQTGALAAAVASSASIWPRAGASQASPSHPAFAAIAGRGFWQALDAAGPQWLVLDLGHVTRLDTVTQRFATAAHWRFRIEGSDSGATASDDEWTLLAGHDGSIAGQTYTDRVQGAWRYIRLVVTGGGVASSAGLRVEPQPASLEAPEAPASPVPARRSNRGPLIIAESCDLWSSPRMWRSLVHAPANWRPLLGDYDEALDSVTQAHIRQALATGIAGFQSCWFREKLNAGQPVLAEYDGLIQSMATSAPDRNRLRWSLFWDNANPAGDGIRDAADFTDHVAPFWIAAYLTRPNYLTLDGRPVVGIANAETFARQAGGIPAGRAALLALRMQARKAGLPGLVLLANNSGNARADNAVAQQLGFDAVMAYATPIYTGLLPSLTPDDAEVMQAERQSWSEWATHSRLPVVLTASVGFDQRPWSGGPVHYLLSPADWRRIVHDAIAATANLPSQSFGRKLLYLDNWNEFGEGHFIEPSVAFGDSYVKGLLPGAMADAGPIAAYGPDPARPGVPDLEIRRLADGTTRQFALTATGERDAAAIGGFLGSGPGRVTRLFDHAGLHDLAPQTGTVGPLVLAGPDIGRTIGLRFDNDGAFQGNPLMTGGKYYAVSLGNPELPASVESGLSIVATIRTGNIVSIALPALLCLGCKQTYPMLVLAGDGDPTLPQASREDMSILYGRSYVAGPALPSTPDAFALALDAHGISGMARGQIRDTAQPLPVNTNLTGLLLGTDVAGAGAGWELGRLELYGRRLAPAELAQAQRRLADGLPSTRGGTFVLDGSSVEAGMGSTDMRNLSRLYEPALPGFAIYNVAVGGAKTIDRLHALPATLSLFPHAAGKSILLCGIGTNTLGTGVPAATAYAQLTDYVRTVRRLRPDIIVGVTTIIPNGYAIDYGYGAQFAPYNRMVIANAAGADFVVDRASDPVMGNPRHFRPVIDHRLSEDGTHPTDFGTAILAAIDNAAIRRALAQAQPQTQPQTQPPPQPAAATSRR